MAIHNEQEQLHASVMGEVKKRSDKLINYFLTGYFVIGLVFASFYDTWLIAIGVGGLSLLAYYSTRIVSPKSDLYQYILSVVLGVFMAQFIYQMHGLFEMHFFAFIGSAILITYQNWKLQIPIMLVVIVHHVAFGYLQNSGVNNVYFTQLDYFELKTFIIHFLLAAIIFFVCGLWAYQLQRYNQVRVGQTLQVGRLQKEAQLAQELSILKEKLEKEKYFLDSLMDNMPDAIYFKDQESKLIRVSKYMADRFGISTDELIGKTDFDFQNKEHAQIAYEDEQIIQKTGQPKIDYIEKEIRTDGNEYWVTTTKMPLINARGEIVGTFGMSRDITKVRELEKERHEADVEKAVAQGKFELASDVMHDIGNAVVGFGSHLTRIRRSLSKDGVENIQKLVEFFNARSTEMQSILGKEKADAVIKMLCAIALTQRNNQEEIDNSITEQLNIVSHIQEILHIQRQYIRGHESTERKPVDMRSVINDSLSMLFGSIEKMAIAVYLDVPEKLPPIKGDRTRLMQVMLNVLKNSIEAIDINAPEKNISFSTAINNDQLTLQIKDNGNGFDPALTEQLFKRGFTTKSSGTGLGLYNCKAIIESHEGTIDITSEGKGKGTVIKIGFKLTA